MLVGYESDEDEVLDEPQEVKPQTVEKSAEKPAENAGPNIQPGTLSGPKIMPGNISGKGGTKPYIVKKSGGFRIYLNIVLPPKVKNIKI